MPSYTPERSGGGYAKLSPRCSYEHLFYPHYTRSGQVKNVKHGGTHGK